MTLSEDVFARTRRARSIPVLATERLTLRAPRHEDVNAIARLASDRRIAENTARIAHPYRVDDAERLIAAVNRQDGEVTFVITLDDTLIGEQGTDNCAISFVFGHDDLRFLDFIDAAGFDRFKNFLAHCSLFLLSPSGGFGQIFLDSKLHDFCDQAIRHRLV